MKVVYVNGHPYGKSYHTAIQTAYLAGLSPEHSVEVLGLGKEDFDPILRFGYAKFMPDDEFIQRSQKLIQEADHLVFSFPLWWGDAPALMKGWIGRVFTPSVAYNVDGLKIHKLLKGKTADLIVTSRGVRPTFWLFGNHGIGIFKRNLFGLCGIKTRRTLVLGGAGLLPKIDTKIRRQKFLDKVKRAAEKLN